MTSSYKKEGTILQEADRITSGDRNKSYGEPSLNHGCTAELWSAYLKRKYGIESKLDARDVCMMMVLLKVSREANGPGRDHLVDIVGYARNAEMIENAQSEEAKD